MVLMEKWGSKDSMESLVIQADKGCEVILIHNRNFHMHLMKGNIKLKCKNIASNNRMYKHLSDA